MKNLLTIMRRDLAAYFTSPIGYIFIIVFLLISVGLYMTSFFIFPVADMRSFFSNLPLIFCVFVPAVTMRVWAEERKENTWEMLLTFPMKAWELVMGKFLALLVFLAITLAATMTVPIMLYALGNPDNGAILSGYFGTLLLGAFFLSIGIFFSGFCKDQIVAFVVTLLACFLIFLLGTTMVASIIDSTLANTAFAGLGATLSQIVGVVDHYNAFIRGVIELADVLYFVAWTALFLVLNMMYLEGRSRRGARTAFGTAVAVCMAIGLLFNWLLSGQSLARFDMTEDKIYTVSDASKRILSQVDTPVQVNLYITDRGEMPTAYKTLEQDIRAKLDELSVAAGGNLHVNTYHMRAANVVSEAAFAEPDEDESEDKEEAFERRMLDKGVEPFSVQTIDQDQVTSKIIYSSIGVGYADAQEEIIPRVTTETLPELEYRLVSTVYKLTRDEKPVIALVAPKESVNIPPQQRQILQQLGQPIPEQEDPYVLLERVLDYEKYEVRRVDLTKDSPLPDEYDTLVVVNPRELSDRQRWEINRAVVSGKPVVMAVQNYQWDYRISRGQLTVSKQDENPQVNPLLEKYGLGVDRDVLMDANKVALTVQDPSNPFANLFGGGQSVDLPMQIMVNASSMDPDTSITSRLSQIFYLWGTGLILDEEVLKQNGLDYRVLMRSSDTAWELPENQQLTQEALEPPAETKSYPLMAMVTGQFPDAYKDMDRPAWPPSTPTPGQFPPPEPDTGDEGPAPELEPAPGKLILLGCSQMFRRNFLQQGNLDLFMNCVDALSLGDDLINVRGRKPIDRAFDRPDEGTQRFWKIVNYAVPGVSIAGVGIAVAAVRRKSRNAYTMAHTQQGRRAV